jgi:hypothetical protein
MKKTTLIIALLIITFSGFTQIANMHTAGGEVIKEKKYVGIEGSAYLTEEWNSGTFIDVDGKNRGDHKLRYNIYDDEVETIREGKEISLNHRIVKEFQIYGLEEGDLVNKYIFRSGYPANDEFSEKSFYQVLADNGDYKLLKKHSCKITQFESKGYGANTVTEKFLQSTKYFIYSENDGFRKVSKSKKSIYDTFPEYEDELKSYIKKNKLNIKKDEDFAQLIYYCNEKG